MSEITAILLAEDDTRAEISFIEEIQATLSFDDECQAQLSVEGEVCAFLEVEQDTSGFALEFPDEFQATLLIDEGFDNIEIGPAIPFGGGEANTGANVGGFIEVFQTKVGAELRFRTLQSSDGSITFTQNTDDIDMRIDPFSVLDLFCYNIVPTGSIDGVNTVFTTPDFFISTTMRLYKNGRRMAQGTGCDYEISESGGVGTGYDTLTFHASIAPKVGDVIIADYIKVP